MNYNGSNIALVTVDGTDFRIQEQSPWSRKWCSHKFRGPGLRYEVGICMQTGWIVWYYGPFPAGMSDAAIFKMNLYFRLQPWERVVADKGYKYQHKVLTPLNAVSKAHKKEMGIHRARHETINGRFKEYGILRKTFRSHPQKHAVCFQAVAAITQLEMMSGGRPPFKV